MIRDLFLIAGLAAGRHQQALRKASVRLERANTGFSRPYRLPESRRGLIFATAVTDRIRN